MTERADDLAVPMGLTRRTVLVRGGAVGLTAVAGGVLAACGGGSSASTAPIASTTPNSGTPKRGGVLTLGYPNGSSSDSIDAHIPADVIDLARDYQLYEPLLVVDDKWNLQPHLATEFTSNQTGDEWTVRLRKGVHFHNGKEMTADDLIFTIKRVLDPKTGAAGGPGLQYVDPGSLKKMDPLTLRIGLTRPFSVLDQQFAIWTNFIVPEGYDPSKPVGTGPFKFNSFTPGQRSVFDAFDDYWQGRPYLDQVVIEDLTDDSARVNALLAGQADAVSAVPYQLIPSILGKDNINVYRAHTAAYFPFGLNCATDQFKDVRVRQAFRLLADREALVNQAYSGYGRVGNDLIAIDDPDYASDLPQRTPDVEKAKSLLKAAGKLDDTFQLTSANLGPGSIESSVVFAQQANNAGVKVKVQKVDNNTYFGPNLYKWPFFNSQWPANRYMVLAGLSYVKGAPYGETHFDADSANYSALYDQAIRTVDPAKRKEIEHEMQKVEYERGPYVVWSFQDLVDAASTKVGGLHTDSTGISFGSADFRRAYLM